ncbi:RAMP superfamily CRISPR-associated protein [Acetobacterium wieringae]|uniref:RAMP superfamily CRISPR-associated protein n=1 Tax=Acetobacterium wieringae TaxID=52694 RepID=A0ABY6HBC4_9FIRM|nr:RAMP superfamily CRISPR-associated protein [Acetobacterium wieringae]UYO61635.1 RAMP superfamily CRISPR-associated protein [Acetobacterium wieringae]
MIANSNPIRKRIVVKIEAKLATPALIGSGNHEHTDNDVLVNRNGEPYLSGATLAGVLRSKLSDHDGNILFGEDSTGDGKMSALWVVDAKFKEAKIIELDGVALDYENKVAISKAKYDFEAVECGAKFTIRMMLVIRKEDDEVMMEKTFTTILARISSGDISVGAKSNRGFGCISCQSEDIKIQTFDYQTEKRAALIRYEAFNWEDSDNWTNYVIKKFDDEDSVMSKTLRLKGSIMIRDTRHLDCDEDYKHICSENGVPVIYGTTWAGAFKGSLYKLLKPRFGEKTEDYLNGYFGYVDEKTKETLPSKIRFNMSTLEIEDKVYDGYRTITRVKINRFTGGAVDGALFTERPWYGGKTTLTIHYPKGCPEIERLLNLGFDALDKGLLTIGGETAIGRGVFEVIQEGK